MTVLIDGPERVARGAALLDQVKPDWPRVVIAAVGVLDMANCSRCVLGYCFGGFATGAQVLNLELEYDEHGFCPVDTHGFDIYPEEDEIDADAAYDELCGLWVTEANKRIDAMAAEARRRLDAAN